MSGGAAGAIELANGDLDGAGIIRGAEPKLAHVRGQLDERLHCPFPMSGGIANDQGAPIILKGASQDFRGRSAEAAGEDDQGPVVQDGWIGIFIDVDAAI